MRVRRATTLQLEPQMTRIYMYYLNDATNAKY